MKPTLRFRPGMERLETRDTPATLGPAPTADLTAGVLTVFGTNSLDYLSVNRSGSYLTVRGNSAAGGTLVRSFHTSTVSQIVVTAEGGDDVVTVFETVAHRTALYGGTGNDTMYGGAGPDAIYGGSGHDALYGRGGNDSVYGEAGTDIVNGGAGTNGVSQGSPARTYVQNSVENEVVRLVNAERAKYGLRPVTVNTLLAGAARNHSVNMAARNTMAHTLTGTAMPNPSNRLDFVGYDNWTTYGENVAYGYRTARDVMTGWMNSAGHRANILNASFREIGVSVYYNAQGTLYWTQVFGSR